MNPYLAIYLIGCCVAFLVYYDNNSITVNDEKLLLMAILGAFFSWITILFFVASWVVDVIIDKPAKSELSNKIMKIINFRIF